MIVDKKSLSANWKELQKTLGGGKKKVSKTVNQKDILRRTRNEIEKKTKIVKDTKIDKKAKNDVEIKVDKEENTDKDAKDDMKSESEGYLAIINEINNNIQEKTSKLREEELIGEEVPISNINNNKVGKYIAMDCECVGVGEDGKESVLARVSIVNYYGNIVLDEYVKISEPVTDWRTWVSGVSSRNMKEAISFKEAQEKVNKLLDKRILIGHALHNDLSVLQLSYPRKMIRDTANVKKFREISQGKTPSLKSVAKEFLQLDIQSGSHSSVEDARVCMMLYKKYRDLFESGSKNESKDIKESKDSKDTKGRKRKFKR